MQDPVAEILATSGPSATVTDSSADLLAFLAVPEASERARRFMQLASARAAQGEWQAAAALCHRAFATKQCQGDAAVRAALGILKQAGDVEGMRKVLIQAGTWAAKAGFVIEALDLLGRAFNIYASHCRQDHYRYDAELFATMDALALSYRGAAVTDPVSPSGGPMRVAVLVFGALHRESVIVRLLAALAEHADRERCQLAFFVPEGRTSLLQSADARVQLDALRAHGWDVVVPDSDQALEVLTGTAAAIREWRADLLLTSALGADLRHYFIAAQKVAPRTVSLVLGPPSQFTAPWVDWNIAVSAHPALDCPGNCVVTPLEFALPRREQVVPKPREALGLGGAVSIVLSAGRAIKFEASGYWQVVAGILDRNPQTVFVALGLEQLPKAADAVPAAARQRVRLLPWQGRYQEILVLADVVLDTFPSGGGAVLIDAMALGVPVLSMGNDYSHEFDQTDWSLGNEIVGMDELVAPHGDHAGLVSRVERLLGDTVERRRLGDLCGERMRTGRGNPARMVSGWLSVFERAVAAKAAGDIWTPPASPAHGGQRPLPPSLVADARVFLLPDRPLLVTIITPTYNRAPFLVETIESVLSQDYPEIEYLILDDGSTDATETVLAPYRSRPGVRIERHANMGETLTVNKGFAMARGDIVCVVNSDDPIMPGAVREAVSYMRKHPEVLAAYPDWIEIGPRSEELKRMRLPNYDLQTILGQFNIALGPGTFIRREAFDLIGYRDPTLRYTGDLDFWLRLARHAPLGHIAELLATHRTHTGAASHFGRGAIMANEIVRLVREAYGSGQLPSSLNRLRFKSFCIAHYAAARAAGCDVVVSARHYVLSAAYAAAYVLRRFLVALGLHRN